MYARATPCLPCLHLLFALCKPKHRFERSVQWYRWASPASAYTRKRRRSALRRRPSSDSRTESYGLPSLRDRLAQRSSLPDRKQCFTSCSLCRLSYMRAQLLFCCVSLRFSVSGLSRGMSSQSTSRRTSPYPRKSSTTPWLYRSLIRLSVRAALNR